jgi:hypothetical protein
MCVRGFLPFLGAAALLGATTAPHAAWGKHRPVILAHMGSPMLLLRLLQSVATVLGNGNRYRRLRSCAIYRCAAALSACE